MQGDQSVNITVSLKIMKKEGQTFDHDLQEIWMTRLPVQNVTCENVQVKG